MGALAREKPRQQLTKQTALAPLPATTDRAETATGTTSKTPTTAKMKAKTTANATKEVEQD
jgi:hypothetical protein